MTKKDAIEAFGSAKAVADALGISEGAVSQWGQAIPYLRQCQIKVILQERGQ